MTQLFECAKRWLDIEVGNTYTLLSYQNIIERPSGAVNRLRLEFRPLLQSKTGLKSKTELKSKTGLNPRLKVSLRFKSSLSLRL